MPQSTVDTILGSMLALLTALALFAIQRQVRAGEKTRNALADIALILERLNTGASAGAREAIANLRTELGAQVRDVGADLERLRREHDALAERHGNLAVGVGTLTERTNANREAISEIRRDHYRYDPRGGTAAPTG